MKSPHNFVVKPLGGNRYNNSKEVGGKKLLLNTEVYHHQFTNRLAEVISVPVIGDDMGLRPGDVVVVHHNVFRRWHDVKGIERNSKNFFKEDTYIISADQMFLYKRDDKWSALSGYCFVQPIKSDKIEEEEVPLKGITIHTDGSIHEGEVVGFTPNSEYEFIIDGMRLYRVLSKFITIKYGRKRNEEAYNPSWAQSCRGVNKSG